MVLCTLSWYLGSCKRIVTCWRWILLHHWLKAFSWNNPTRPQCVGVIFGKYQQSYLSYKDKASKTFVCARISVLLYKCSLTEMVGHVGPKDLHILLLIYSSSLLCSCYVTLSVSTCFPYKACTVYRRYLLVRCLESLLEVLLLGSLLKARWVIFLRPRNLTR